MSSDLQKSPVVKLAMLGTVMMALFYVNQGTGWVNQYITALPVQGRQEAAKDGEVKPRVMEENKTLNPLLIESSRKASKPLDSLLPSGFDVAFGKTALDNQKKTEEERKKKELEAPAAGPSAEVAIDYFEVMKQLVNLQAISARGAIVNNHYYEVGESIEELSYPDSKTGVTLLLKLASVSPTHIVLSNPAGTRRFSVKIGE